MIAGGVNFGAKAAPGKSVFKKVTVITGRLALSKHKDIGQTERHGRERGNERNRERFVKNHQQDEEHDDAGTDSANEPPKEAAFQTPGPAFGIRRGVGVSQAKLTFGAHGGWGGMAVVLGF